MSEPEPVDETLRLSEALNQTLADVRRLALEGEPGDELAEALHRARVLLDELEREVRRDPQGRAATLGSLLELRGTVAGLLRLMPQKEK